VEVVHTRVVTLALPGMTGCVVMGRNNHYWIVTMSSLFFES